MKEKTTLFFSRFQGNLRPGPGRASPQPGALGGGSDTESPVRRGEAASAHH